MQMARAFCFGTASTRQRTRRPIGRATNTNTNTNANANANAANEVSRIG
jgi:hypothetical protein